MNLKRIIITGIVQGVGFRPFLFRELALFNKNNPYKITGEILNSGNLGVVLDLNVEDETFDYHTIIDIIKEQSPKMAFIEDITLHTMPEEKWAHISQLKEIKIIKSSDLVGETITLPPDIGMCDECIREFSTDNSRWGEYEFISCVKCGPRYTLMKELPYDRERSTMKEFPFCEDCQKEYNNIDNRRFHAQTFGCRNCGPKYFSPNKTSLESLVEEIKGGKIAAIKGIGGVNLLCRADNFDIIQKIRERKGERKYKPFAIMVPDIEMVRELCETTVKIEKLLTSYRRPIVLCPKRKGSNLPENISPGLPNIGIILPYMGIHYLLFKRLGRIPLIFTSGNTSNLPMAITNLDIQTQLKDVADIFFLHNREISQRCDDSVIRFVCDQPAIIRRSRGYVPEYIRLPFTPNHKAMIAVGPELNSTGAVSKGDRIFPTQHIGNVSNLETYTFLEEALLHLKDLLKISDTEVGIIATDLHPLFHSTKLAHSLSKSITKNIPIIPIQHHHAHLAALMVDHNMGPEEKIVAITIDGVGYGEDSQPWGGEILLGGYDNYEHKAHLQPIPMIGGDVCAKQPCRMLICTLLSSHYEENLIKKFIETSKIAENFPYKETELSLILKQFSEYKHGNRIFPFTTSMGRWLDSVSSLFNVCHERTYRGEPAMRLEGFIWEAPYEKFFSLDDYIVNKQINTGAILYDTMKLLLEEERFKDIKEQKILARSLVEDMATMLAKVAMNIAEEEKIRKIGVSGGVAYNEIIVSVLKREIESRNFYFLQHKRISCGDAGISIGQLAIASLKKKNFHN